MKGRKQLPTNLKVIRGTAQPCRINDKEPKPEKTRRAPPPKTLSEEARKHWRKISKELEACGVLTQVDKDALAVYCELYAQWVEAGEMVKKKGMVIADPRYADRKTEKGRAMVVPVLSPYFKASLKLSEQMKQMLCEFGMTPSSRSRIRAEGDKPEDDFDAWQKRRRMSREGV